MADVIAAIPSAVQKLSTAQVASETDDQDGTGMGVRETLPPETTKVRLLRRVTTVPGVPGVQRLLNDTDEPGPEINCCTH